MILGHGDLIHADPSLPSPSQAPLMAFKKTSFRDISEISRFLWPETKNGTRDTWISMEMEMVYYGIESHFRMEVAQRAREGPTLKCHESPIYRQFAKFKAFLTHALWFHRVQAFCIFHCCLAPVFLLSLLHGHEGEAILETRLLPNHPLCMRHRLLICLAMSPRLFPAIRSQSFKGALVPGRPKSSPFSFS